MRIIIAMMTTLLIYSCDTSPVVPLNPAAEGFNAAESDAKAIEIADSVMVASGGRDTWDATDYFQWRFFGNRLHTWNKSNGDLIIESEKDTSLYQLNLKTMEGSAMIKGKSITDEAELKEALQRAKEYWINDSYWIFLPYKLKDSGVTLKYLGAGKNAEGLDSEMLQLTFEEVGVTPENKYVVYVDKQTNLINQWDFYTNYEDKEPRFSTPWKEYKDYNGLMLSSSRGQRGMQDIAVGPQFASKWKEK